MRLNLYLFCLVLSAFVFSYASFAQTLTCPSPYIYMDGSQFIKFYNPALPLGANNPANTNIPTFGSGLTLMPNINGGTLSPTFYSTSGGTYWYWNGVSWVNTGHSTGNGAAVNVGGCGGKIYNIVGGTGQIYVYDGTANGSLLTTINGFNGGGPYDLTTDCNCNFYVLKTTTAGGQYLACYSQQGVFQYSLSLVNFPNATAGGGFGIIGNMVYVKNNLANGFFIGTISGASVTFTQVNGFIPSPGDFASCPTCSCVPPPAPAANITSGILSCSVPTINVIASTTANAANYSWTGPGIIGPSNGSVISASVSGIYTCVITTGTCFPAAPTTMTTSISSITTAITASLSPSGSICIPAGQNTPLTLIHNAANASYLWSGSPLFAGQGSGVALINQPGTYSVTVTNTLNGCSSGASVQVAVNPTVVLSLTNNTLCAQPINGSPNSISLTASGASSYSVLVPASLSGSVLSNGFSGISNGSVATQGVFTVTGQNGYCFHTTTTSFSVIANPVLSITPLSSSICPYQSQTFTANGASSYTWTGNQLMVSPFNVALATPSTSQVYTLSGEALGCVANPITSTLIVLPLPQVSISQSHSLVCLGESATLSAFGTAAQFSWSPVSGLNVSNSATVIASPTITQMYTLLGALNGCTANATATLQIQNPPTIQLSLSNTSLCSQSHNNSVNTITVNPSGAVQYTFLPSSNIALSSINGYVTQVTAFGNPPLGIYPATLGLIGKTGVCTVSIITTFSIISNPSISVNPPNPFVCPGTLQTFSASGASTYTWLPQISYSLASYNSINAFPVVTTTYAVYGTSLGCNSQTKFAVLNMLPVPELTLSPQSASLCVGQSLSLTVQGNGTSYYWQPSTGLSSITGTAVGASPSSSITYTVVSALNSCTNSAQTTLSVVPLPTISCSASQFTVCKGRSTYLTASGALAYQWLPDTHLNVSGGPTVIASPQVQTIYTVSGFNGSCSGTKTLQVFVQPSPNMVLNASQNVVCSGNSMTLSVYGAQSYTWLPLNGLIINGTNTLVTVKPETTTHYTVIGANYAGNEACIQQLSYSVMVQPYAQAKAIPNASVCSGKRTTISASGGNYYVWSPVNGLLGFTGASVVAGPSVTTIYTVEASWNGYCGSKTTVTVNVMPKPKVFAGRDTSYQLNESIFLQATGSGTLEWIAGDGILCKTCASTQIIPLQSDCYTVRLTDDRGCVAEDEVCIDIQRDFNAYIPNTFTPNNDGLNDEFKIYGENLSKFSLTVYNRWGQQLYYSEDSEKGWDGTFKHQLCKEDVYLYKVVYTGLDGKKYERMGSIQLLP